jgi:catechol 2,3-dioxygenase-like lactoylglutathione lyase family enzyme
MPDQAVAAPSRAQPDIWHVAYPVADIDRSIAFYCDGLGFELVGRDGDAVFVSLGKGGFTIELLAQPQGKAANPRRAPDHIAFDSADLDAYREKLIKAGLTVPPIHVIGEGMKRFALDDPDGVRLDFFQGREGLEAFISGAR